MVVALHRHPRSPVELLVSAGPDEQTPRAAGVERAAALALTYGDDQIYDYSRPSPSTSPPGH